MGIIVSEKTRAKLETRHRVKYEEVMQCFTNLAGKLLRDTREEHRSDPPTNWFIAETDYGRKLKVVFILRGGDVHIRTAYEPNEDELRIYRKYGAKSA